MSRSTSGEDFTRYPALGTPHPAPRIRHDKRLRFRYLADGEMHWIEKSKTSFTSSLNANLPFALVPQDASPLDDWHLDPARSDIHGSF